MKKHFLFLILLLAVSTAFAQQKDSLRFHIRIDSCFIKSTVLNTSQADFYLTVKNTSDVLLLFRNGKTELGIKLYVNYIIEDDEELIIMKHVFMKKEDDEWEIFNTSSYYPIEEISGSRSIKVGSDQAVPDFFVQYTISIADNEPGAKSMGQGQIIPEGVPAGKKKRSRKD